MSDLLNTITSDNLVLLCVIMGVVALFLAIAIAVEIYNNNKQYKKNVITVTDENKEDSLNIQEDSEIKYVDEDSELEKTKAKIELAELREKLKKEEEEKKKLLEANLALAKQKIEKEKEEELSKTIEIKPVSTEPVKVVENKESKLDETLNKLRVSSINNAYTATKRNNEEKVEVKEEKIEESKQEEIDNSYDDEENAIISIEELQNASSFGYTDEEMDKYVDEKDAIISIQELEKLYKESLNIEVVEEEPKIEFEMKRVADLPKISDEKIFRSTPFISPVYGTTQTETDLVLEQTANLEKLNEEIRKTNEFLKTLKDLKKNLE